MIPHRRVLVFARPPVPGVAKTRLIPALGPAGAAQLHARLLHRTVRTVCSEADWRPELWAAAPCDHPFFEMPDLRGVTRHCQEDGDLGTRMYRALASTTEPGSQSVLVGSDCPGLTVPILAEAFEALAHCDVVLGPARDGGYYLIGARCAPMALFAGMPWGSDRVLALTRERLRCLGCTFRELVALRDVDRPEDLAHFPELSDDATPAPVENSE